MARGRDRGDPARSVGRDQILDEIVAERTRQDEQWGGAAHDDTLDGGAWLDIMYKQLRAAYLRPQDYRERLVKVAALALAGIESLDRLRATPLFALERSPREMEEESGDGR